MRDARQTKRPLHSNTNVPPVPSPTLTCATATFLSSVAFMSPASSAATLSCSSRTRARMLASFLLAPSSLRLASASAARLGATTW